MLSHISCCIGTSTDDLCGDKASCTNFCRSFGGTASAHEDSWTNIAPGCTRGSASHCWWNTNTQSTTSVASNHQHCPSVVTSCTSEEQCTTSCTSEEQCTSFCNKKAREVDLASVIVTATSSWTNIPSGCVWSGAHNCWFNTNTQSTAALDTANGHKVAGELDHCISATEVAAASTSFTMPIGTAPAASACVFPFQFNGGSTQH